LKQKNKENKAKKKKQICKEKKNEIGTLVSRIVERTTGQHFLGRN